ncbi:hypothetical protein [Natrialbaceae archaeon AArc-T1-2]|nr:hypothetical protein [Natrialbaceae archaeon AArc-T1-2]WIV68884.1 hypothetical protein QQ977_16515 [Natrialbaceae archaeon AArc-T1-2]
MELNDDFENALWVDFTVLTGAFTLDLGENGDEKIKELALWILLSA